MLKKLKELIVLTGEVRNELSAIEVKMSARVSEAENNKRIVLELQEKRDSLRKEIDSMYGEEVRKISDGVAENNARAAKLSMQEEKLKSKEVELKSLEEVLKKKAAELDAQIAASFETPKVGKKSKQEPD